MPVPKFPGHEETWLQKIDGAKKIRQHQEGPEVDVTLESGMSFSVGRVLGQGSFGCVFEAMNDKTGEMVAIKQIELRANKQRQQQQLKMAHDELEMMRKLRHPNIVSVKGCEMTGNLFSIVMELVAGRSLAEMLLEIGAFHENVIRKFTNQLLLALEYCHAKKCTHRDIKGKNILLTTDGQVRLCDFGSAKIREETIDKDAVSATYSYTPLWVAPETLNAMMYNEKVDIWALGCVVIEMGSGKDPWSEMNFRSSYAAVYHIGSSGAIPLIPARLSPVAHDFVRQCLIRDPDKRPSASELLKHAFIVGITSSVPSSPESSPNSSASAQMTQIAVMVDTRLKTREVANSTAPAAAPVQVVLIAPKHKNYVDDSVPLPPFANNDAAQAIVSPPSLELEQVEPFNVVYSFCTSSLPPGAGPVHGQVTAEFAQSDTVLMHSGSSIFQHELSISASYSGGD